VGVVGRATAVGVVVRIVVCTGAAAHERRWIFTGEVYRARITLVCPRREPIMPLISQLPSIPTDDPSHRDFPVVDKPFHANLISISTAKSTCG
jgi:hypothetical protein